MNHKLFILIYLLTMKLFTFSRPTLLLAFVLTSGFAAADTPKDVPDRIYIRRIDSLKQLLAVRPLPEIREMEHYHEIASIFHTFNHDSSAFYGHKAMALAQKLKADEMLIDIYCNLGVTHCFASHYDSAYIYFDRMQALAAARKDKWNEIKAITMFGFTYAKQGKYHTSLEYYMKVLPIVEREGWTDRNVGALANLSEINRRIGNTEMAINYLQQAEEKCNTLHEIRWHMPHIYNEYAFNYLKLRDLDMALYYALKADSINPGTAVNACYTNGLLATVYLQHEDYDRALQYARKSFAYADELKDKNLYAYAGKILSDIYMAQEYYPEAEAEALKVWETDSTFIDESRDIAKNIAMANICMNRMERAAIFLTKYAELNEQYAERNFQTTVSDLGVKYEIDKKETRIATLENERRMYFWLSLTGILLAVFLGIALFQAIRNARKERQLIATEAIQKGEIGERTRISKDLHDRLGGSLSAVKIGLKNAESLQVIHEKIDICMKELREIMNNIMPISLQKHGLKGALEDFCMDFSNLYFHFFGEAMRIDPNKEYNLYCSVRELVNNALKHSDATKINLQLIQSNKHVSLTIQDDGCGFDEKTVEQGYGLENIRNRVSSCRGKLDMTSAPGKGTETVIELKVDS